MAKIEIRRVTINDISQLQEIGRKTFSETFSVHNTKENMDKYLEESFNTVKLISEVENLNSEFYFAIVNNEVTGYMKVNRGPAQSDLQDHDSLEIERIYVMEEYQGRSIGRALFDKAMEVARQSQVKLIWLGVWENNHKALRFYRRQGFTEFNSHIFRLGNEEQTDLLMKIDLTQNSAELY